MHLIVTKRKLLLLCQFLIILTGCAAVVTERPPDNKLIVIPAAPGNDFIWVNDSWRYNREVRLYQSAPGRWVKPSGHKTVWVDGYWVQTHRGWKYINGHWRH